MEFCKLITPKKSIDIASDEEYLDVRRVRNGMRDQYEKSRGRSHHLKSIKKLDSLLEDYKRKNPGVENKYEG